MLRKLVERLVRHPVSLIEIVSFLESTLKRYETVTGEVDEDKEDDVRGDLEGRDLRGDCTLLCSEGGDIKVGLRVNRRERLLGLVFILEVSFTVDFVSSVLLFNLFLDLRVVTPAETVFGATLAPPV